MHKMHVLPDEVAPGFPLLENLWQEYFVQCEKAGRPISSRSHGNSQQEACPSVQYSTYVSRRCGSTLSMPRFTDGGPLVGGAVSTVQYSRWRDVLGRVYWLVTVVSRKPGWPLQTGTQAHRHTGTQAHLKNDSWGSPPSETVALAIADGVDPCCPYRVNNRPEYLFK